MIVVAWGTGFLVPPVPMVASMSDITIVEYLGVALCRTGDAAFLVVPVSGPYVDCSLHFGK